MNNLVNNIFKRPFIFTKVENVNGFSSYMIRVKINSSRYVRYVVIITPLDNNPIGTRKTLYQLNWISFQTKTLEDVYYKVLEYDSICFEKLNKYCFKCLYSDEYKTIYYNYNSSANNCILILLSNKYIRCYPNIINLEDALNTFQASLMCK